MKMLCILIACALLHRGITTVLRHRHINSHSASLELVVLSVIEQPERAMLNTARLTEYDPPCEFQKRIWLSSLVWGVFLSVLYKAVVNWVERRSLTDKGARDRPAQLDS
jgi:hypothetical protein